MHTPELLLLVGVVLEGWCSIGQTRPEQVGYPSDCVANGRWRFRGSAAIYVVRATHCVLCGQIGFAGVVVGRWFASDQALRTVL